eukprot:2340889-Rhodomonas_salina.2
MELMSVHEVLCPHLSTRVHHRCRKLLRMHQQARQRVHVIAREPALALLLQRHLVRSAGYMDHHHGERQQREAARQ